jgi:2-polyprenyl-3-methyl-5-hydroxy-6-metoxy-1,4-benzoquinol methylase
MNTASESQKDASARAWPRDGQERVEACPVCGEKKRSILHPDLTDDVFRCAPGKWPLWRCFNCGSAYLDPRPTHETIHIAYKRYYTHSAGEGRKDFESLGLVHRMVRVLANGYANWRYGLKRQPSSILGTPLAYCVPPFKGVVDRAFRHLPRSGAQLPSLLDVGCGNGKFLKIAAECGWRAVGVDPDPRAVEKAKELGLEVYEGGIEVIQQKRVLFDCVCLSHVIEHVHNPTSMLTDCFHLLKPGGTLWLETPNINSFGHGIYRDAWRGIETPRHLVIFNKMSLIRTLQRVGFENVQSFPQIIAVPGMFRKSEAIRRGRSPYDITPMSVMLLVLAGFFTLVGVLFPSRGEFLTIAVRKPEGRQK